LPQHVTVRLPTHAGLERGRKDLILEKFVNEDDGRPCDEYHERHPHKQSGVIAEKARSCRCAFHEVDQLGDESREQYLADGRQQIEKEDQRESWPYRSNEMPIKRQGGMTKPLRAKGSIRVSNHRNMNRSALR
jgi:hypothetical protein